jgi:hypothetical protein
MKRMLLLLNGGNFRLDLSSVIYQKKLRRRAYYESQRKESRQHPSAGGNELLLQICKFYHILYILILGYESSRSPGYLRCLPWVPTLSPSIIV